MRSPWKAGMHHLPVPHGARAVEEQEGVRPEERLEDEVGLARVRLVGAEGEDLLHAVRVGDDDDLEHPDAHRERVAEAGVRARRGRRRGRAPIAPC